MGNFCFLIGTKQKSFVNIQDEPTTFQEAWWHPDENKRKKWCKAICLEFYQMLKLGVWRKEGSLSKIPPNRKGIGTKWVFKKKKNGVY